MHHPSLIDGCMKMAERLHSSYHFLSLACHKAIYSSIGLLLDSHARSEFHHVFVMHAYSFCHAVDDCLLLQGLIGYNSLDFLGMIPSI